MHVVTANDLKTGLVVYLTAAGEWTTDVSQARLALDGAEGETLLAAARQSAAARRVVEPYLIEVEAADGAHRPRRLRESIRAGGPTVPSDFSRPSDKRA